MRISQLIKPLIFFLPLLEIAGFIVVGKWIGVLPTLLLIILTTVIGLFILRVQGFVTLAQMQQRINAGEYPALDALGSGLLMFGGFLLLLPGFITDIIGLLLVFPITRRKILAWLINKSSLNPGAQQPHHHKKAANGSIIEGEFRRE